MNLVSLVLIAFAVSIDGFWGGFSFGLRKVRIKLPSLIVIAFMSVICSMVTMLIGYSLKSHISLQVAKYIGAGLLILLGVLTLKESRKQGEELSSNKIKVTDFRIRDLIKVLRNPILSDIDKENDIKPGEGIILGLAVAMDASIAAFTVSLMGVNPYTTPFLFGLTHFLLIGIGNVIARHTHINQIGQKYCFLPGVILMILGVLRLV